MTYESDEEETFESLINHIFREDEYGDRQSYYYHQEKIQQHTSSVEVLSGVECMLGEILNSIRILETKVESLGELMNQKEKFFHQGTSNCNLVNKEQVSVIKKKRVFSPDKKICSATNRNGVRCNCYVYSKTNTPLCFAHFFKTTHHNNVFPGYTIYKKMSQ